MSQSFVFVSKAIVVVACSSILVLEDRERETTKKKGKQRERIAFYGKRTEERKKEGRAHTNAATTATRDVFTDLLPPS